MYIYRHAQIRVKEIPKESNMKLKAKEGISVMFSVG